MNKLPHPENLKIHDATILADIINKFQKSGDQTKTDQQTDYSRARQRAPIINAVQRVIICPYADHVIRYK